MKIFNFITFTLFCSCLLIGCTQPSENEQKAEAPVALSDSALVQRGKYLVGIMGCQDCHSPKQMGPRGPEVIAERHLSGYPSDRPVGKIVPEAMKNGWMLFGGDGTSAAGPWGVSFAANLTSDTTGIGTWTFEQFRIAITQGKYKGLPTSRPLLPPMPWTNYVNMEEEDLQAVFAYLKSTPPVRNVVPAPVPPAL